MTPLHVTPSHLCEGSPPFNRGGGQTLLELHPKKKNEEMPRFARNDTKKSFLGEKAKIFRFAQDDTEKGIIKDGKFLYHNLSKI
jgi:hypothetical protein